MLKPEYEVIKFGESVLKTSEPGCPSHCAPDCDVISPECHWVCEDYCCNSIDD